MRFERFIATQRSLYVATLVVLFVQLGSAELWTHEGRWAILCQTMVETGDYLHPSEFGEDYPGKPLLSYWMVLGFSWLLGGISELTVRLPSALAGMLTVVATVRIGRELWNRQTGVLAGWVLLTTFQFVFWARCGSADMLNVAAVTGAVAWFMTYRDRPGFLTYAVFFTIVAVGCHLKGILAAALTLLLLLPDLLRDGRWRMHLRPSIVPALAVGEGIFVALHGFGGLETIEIGIANAYYENFHRYVSAFDHRNELHIFFKYLPLYMLPWTLLLPWVVARALRQWRSLGPSTRYVLWASALIFVFFTASTSRRGYYILPMLPFLALATAEWLRAAGTESRRLRLALPGAAIVMLGTFVFLGVVRPMATSEGGMRQLRDDLRATLAGTDRPWEQWDVLLFATQPAAGFYLTAPGRHCDRKFNRDEVHRVERYFRQHPAALLVTRRQNLKYVGEVFPDPIVVEEIQPVPAFLRPHMESNKSLLVALIPRQPLAENR